MALNATLDTVVEIVARILVAIFAALAVIHVYWAAGGTDGKEAAIPEVHGRREFNPSRLGTLMVAIALLGAAAVAALSGHLIDSPLPTGLVRVGAFALGIALVARAIGDFRLVGFFKRIRGSRFARLDTQIFSPLCLCLGAAVLYVGWHDV